MQLTKRAEKVHVAESIVVRTTNFLRANRAIQPASKMNVTLFRRMQFWSFRKSKEAKVGVVQKSTRLTAQTSILSVTIPIHISGDTLEQIRPFLPSRWQINCLLLLSLLGLLLLLAIVQQVGRTLRLAEIILLGINDLVRCVFSLANKIVGIR
ncbi:hypothetical protein INT44_000564 [Umbelopsis vinacea]|uniref:Uncharacterized protein n=1 Tax=Umbelopsis vinacea TaxID=44442 RepID=A0A8H7PLV2_9FUNG|nr:hypothetical protein INT44_000564 [Umbelopsis vinacea]